MDVRNAAFLNILRAALAGIPAELTEELSPEDWQTLARLAYEHHVQPLVYEAAHHLPQAHAVLGQQGAAVRRQVAGQVMRTERFLEVSRAMEQAGLKPLVVKGIVCRGLYPKPDLRPSSDEDLLIPDAWFTPCGTVLEACGLATTDPADAFERSYRSWDMPFCIELHRHLFDPASGAYGHWNRFFDGVFDRAVELRVQGQTLLTMAPTDHMLYLILHAFKHFLHSGFGIRQVCDMVLCANAWGPRIDWAWLLDCCSRVRAQGFAAAIFRIGEKYLGFDPVRAAYPACWQALEADEGPLLEDLLSGGVFGGATQARKQSSNVTLGAVTNQKSTALGNALFPPISSLSGRYPYLKKYPWLLPWAWLYRIVTYKKTHRAEQARQTMQIGNQRLELLRQYGVINECE